MPTEHVLFTPTRSMRQYLGQAGHEASGQMLSFAALDSLAEGQNKGHAPDMVVIGEYREDDGRRYLEFGATSEHIIANSDYRIHPVTNKLRLQCPACELWDGRHTRGCER